MIEMQTLKVWGWYEYLIEDQVQRDILKFAVLNRPDLLRRCNQLLWKVLVINFLNRISRLALFVKCKASKTCSVSFVKYGGIWSWYIVVRNVNPLKPELNPICYLLALLAHRFLHGSRIRVKSLTSRLLMSYIYGAPILDVSRSHTTTQHSR